MTEHIMIRSISDIRREIIKLQKTCYDLANYPEGEIDSILDLLGEAEAHIRDFDWQEYYEGERVKAQEMHGDQMRDR